jgi:hypothetical protein
MHTPDRLAILETDSPFSTTTTTTTKKKTTKKEEETMARTLKSGCCIGALALVLPVLIGGCDAGEDTYTLGECGEEVCGFDQACLNETECVSYPCDPVAKSADCAEFFNNGFECAEADDGSVCLTKADYCDDATPIPCQTWQDCTDNACVNKPEYCDDATTCETWQDCTEHLCVDKDGACLGGHTDCGAGEFCNDADSVCAAPDNTCAAAEASTVVYTQDAPVIWGVTEVLDTTGADYAPGGSGGGPADTCTDNTRTLHAYELQYYAPLGDFPTTNAELYAAMDYYSGTSTGGGTWFAWADGETSSGVFVVFLCILDSTTDAVWALVFDNGIITSDAVCFDINPTT